MFNIIIIAIGNLKKGYYKEAGDEYLKRLNEFGKVKVIELKAEPFSENTRKKAKEEEGKRIIRALEKYKDARILILDENGDEYDSKGFAKFLGAQHREIVFVIGGALGLDEEVLKYADKKLSLSQMTLPHELARVVLLEQLYRAGTIIKGKTYHY